VLYRRDRLTVVVEVSFNEQERRIDVGLPRIEGFQNTDFGSLHRFCS